MSNINASIKLGSGFLLKNAPVDLKTTAATIEERNSYVKANVLYKGATVYVEADDTRYRFTGVQPEVEDYSKCWVIDVPAGDASAGVDSKINAAIKTQVTNNIGKTIQAHSDQLDKVGALAETGIVFRKNDGTIQAVAVEAGDASVTVATDPEAKKITVALPATGNAGTYTKVTTDAQGRVTKGENPTTLEGYGIQDGVHKAGDTLTGLLKYGEGITEDQFDDQTLVPKYYADSVALGYVTHEACETGSNENVAGVYANGSQAGSLGVGATFTFDADTGNKTALNGVTLKTGMRVLLVGQTDAKQNGAYVVTNVPEAATGKVVMERADDLDGHPKVSYDGASFLISQGTLKGTVWKLSNQGTIVFGTDDISFVQAFAPTQYIEGAGISVDANTISVKQGETVKVIGDKLEVSSGTGNQGKMLVAQGDGQAAIWQKVETDFQTIAPKGEKGDIMYHDGSKWTLLKKGAANTLLGVGADGEVTYLAKIEQGTF